MKTSLNLRQIISKGKEGEERIVCCSLETNNFDRKWSQLFGWCKRIPALRVYLKVVAVKTFVANNSKVRFSNNQK